MGLMSETRFIQILSVVFKKKCQQKDGRTDGPLTTLYDDDRTTSRAKYIDEIVEYIKIYENS